ncbi:breast cancer type 1 susceptibility protein homolog [Achroia grisella]|uniref:breast cancer type 1 susceptibility protein homolog n=1 Tax=Achroia grisella TaxID=688607 RepID=UPI0027D2876D|nr:breast cancer type 1 susceptibility protein homolog [Achroia grisella]
MTIQELNIRHITKLISSLLEQVTCLECCRYYIAPETAKCGHTFCHTCWRKQRTCPSCAAPLEKRALRLNIPVQNKTDHIHTLIETFEKNFNIKLNEFLLNVQDNELHSEHDPTKNVKNWLENSENHFSAPLPSSENLTQDVILVEQLTSKVQIHTDTKRTVSPKKVIHKQQPQDDWEKIEMVSVTNENINKFNKNNPSEEYTLHDKNNTMVNPRRSSRKRDFKNNEPDSRNHDISRDKNSSKNSSVETEIKSNKNKKNWGNVKKMRKEFSKLNKQNRNKLNVSIEMCRKGQASIKRKPETTTNSDSKNYDHIIEDTTTNLINKVETASLAHTVSGKTVNTHDSNFEKNIQPEKKESPIDTSNIIETEKKHHNNYNKIKQSSEKSQVDVAERHQKMTFVKKSSLQPRPVENNVQTSNYDIHCNSNDNMDDIEITIKIGNSLTNIFIKKKKNNSDYSLHTDKEVQTTLGPHTLSKNISCNNMDFNDIGDNKKSKDASVVSEKMHCNIASNNSNIDNNMKKSLSVKRNTASADTKTAPVEITESVEKELCNIMECEATDSCPEKQNLNNMKPVYFSTNVITNTKEDDVNELDIFDSNSVKEANVQLLKNTKHTTSEILMPTIKSNKMQKGTDKRGREINDDLPSSKKIKLTDKNDVNTQENNEIHSEVMNYDIIMGQVFSSIDADIRDTQKSKNMIKNDHHNKTGTTIISLSEDQQKELETSGHKVTLNNENNSENVFSYLDKENDFKRLNDLEIQVPSSTQQHIEDLLTPGLCQNLASTHEVENEEKELCTPLLDIEIDDSDKSIVEETPQKTVSFTRPKNKNESRNDEAEKIVKSKNKHSSDSEGRLIESIINISDTVPKSTKGTKDLTVIAALPRKNTLETPVTINRFVDHIKHKSTPIARKSLHFDTDNIDDIDQTLCPTTEPIVKTTQEKEFLCKAFEESPQSPIRMPLISRNIKNNNMNNCLAGSCLNPVELTKVKLLCRQYNWQYTDKYTKDLTHLVVGVDDENRSQRSVKYMCALAASKWIVSFEWVQNCLKSNQIVKEEQYEALDGTGEPGPKRSRLAKKKLFEGIIFYCMPPFSILDVNTLKDILEAAGGRVVNEAKAVRVTGNTPALLLAEPENTQENKFIYLAMELNIVPVNHEWALNSLGSYTLNSIHELLLCPAALLPAATACWPADLVSQDCD